MSRAKRVTEGMAQTLANTGALPSVIADAMTAPPERGSTSGERFCTINPTAFISCDHACVSAREAMVPKPNAVEIRFERDAIEVREERNRCSARRKKAEVLDERWALTCTSAGYVKPGAKRLTETQRRGDRFLREESHRSAIQGPSAQTHGIL